MGAEQFSIKVKGFRTPEEAFTAAVAKAQYDHGHSGYTGTIAEKDSFLVLDVPTDVDPEFYAQQLIRKGHPSVDGKWDPAGCVCLSKPDDPLKTYLFFGWASS